jgi:predicted secreted protein
MASPTANDDVLTGRVGAPVRILLESTPGTGAIWYAPVAPPHATIDSLDSISAGPGIGGPVQQVFLFRADAPGTYTLNFQLKRVWEPVVRRERHFVIQIDTATP